MIDKKKVVHKLEETNEAVLHEIKKLEPNHSEIYSSYTSNLKVVFENTDFSVMSSNEASFYGLRTIVKNRLGFVSTNNLTKDHVKDFAHEGQMIAQLSPENPHNQFPQDSSGEKYFENYDEEMERLAPKDLMKYAQMIVDEAKSDSRIKIERAEIDLSFTVFSVMNSYGVKRTAAQTSSGWFVMGVAKDGDHVTSFDYDGDTVSQKSEMEPRIIESVARFRESVAGSIGASHGMTYKGPVLLHPDAVLGLLGGVISDNCLGNLHADHISPWRGKLGELVASEMIDAFQDPTNKARVTGWLPFDREGVLTKKQNLLSQGVLSFVAHNAMSASHSGTHSTGNAVGGARGVPGVGISNFGICASAKAKSVSDEEIFKLLNRGLVLKRFSGNDDTVSGQFSGVAKNSTVFENGSHRPVQEVMVAGNMFEMLNQIIAVGSQSHPTLGNGLAPYVLVDGLSITAN